MREGRNGEVEGSEIGEVKGQVRDELRGKR